MHFRGEAQVRQLLLIIGVCLFLPLTAPAVQDPPKNTPVIVVGGDRDYPPYEFIDKSGVPSGYNVALNRAIAEVMGMKIEFRLGAWSNI